MTRIKHKITRDGNRILMNDHIDILELAEKHRFRVKSVCSEIGLTSVQFETLMLKFLEIQPKDLFRRHRALMARRQMMEGASSHTISESLGFKNYSHFCIEIKFFYGIPPQRLSKKLTAYQ
ncbi:MAG: helix-turn-helix domain-containing protein [Akkermansiaceae bacterium]